MVKKIIFSFLVYGITVSGLQAQTVGQSDSSTKPSAISCLDIEIQINAINKTIDNLTISLMKAHDMYDQRSENGMLALDNLKARIAYGESTIAEAKNYIDNFGGAAPKDLTASERKALASAREKFKRLTPLLKRNKILLIKKTYELDMLFSNFQYKSQELELKILKAKEALTLKENSLSDC